MKVVILEWFVNTPVAATTPTYYCIYALPTQNRSYFQKFPNVCTPISHSWKKVSMNSCHHCKLHPR